MRRNILLFISISVALFILGAHSVIAREAHSKKPPAKSVEEKAGSADEMAEAFAKARDALKERDFKTAAREIRKAEGMLKAAARDATDETREELQSAADGLEALAKKSEKGKVTGRKELNRNFGHAHYAMARHHREKAKQHIANKENAEAGAELKESAAHLEKAMALTGRKAGHAVVENAKLVGDKLIAGKDWSQQKVSDTFDSLGQKIEDVGAKVKK